MRDRVVVVTGGARGIGLAIARALADAGARVAIGDLDGDVAAARAAELGGIGRELDVRCDRSYQDFLAAVTARFAPVDILVNNAGVALPGAFVDTTPAEHDLQYAVNLGGVERGIRLVLPSMLGRRRGHIITIASAAGRIPAPQAAVYTASKHAVVGLTDALRFELRGSGVHLTTVLPAVVGTEMAAGLRLRGLPRMTPQAVAALVVRYARRRRPPATVVLPRWLAPVALIDAASPQWVRALARRLASVQAPADPGGWAYRRRVARQLAPTPVENVNLAIVQADALGSGQAHP